MTAPAAVDEIFADFVSSGRAPGVAYGVVSDGVLAHSGAVGLDQSADCAILRIASMTKSFVAAAVLALRDRGQLGLDEPVSKHVPQLAWLDLPIADSQSVTVRQLLTMSTGLPTDDPWADRMESTSPEQFDALMARGFRFASAPGTSFAYSNLGFAILGRIVTNRAGVNFRDFVRTEFLDPLGMRDTRFSVAELDPARVVVGHRRAPSRWEPVDQTGPGEFSAIGGLYSTVGDLARWVGFFLDAYPARDDSDAGPLSRSSRREMQQLQRLNEVIAELDNGRPHGVAVGYGLGLFIRQSTTDGELVYHSGGYPGFGSHMCWSPRRGVGIVALANGTYASTRDACTRALRLLAKPDGASLATETHQSEAVARAVARLATEFDDTLANQLFAPNIDLDEPRDERRARFETAGRTAGALLDCEVLSAEPASCVLCAHGERADLRVDVVLTPEPDGRAQRAEVTVLPEPPRELARFAEMIVAALNEGRSVPDGVDPDDFALAAACGENFGIDPRRTADDGEPAVRVRARQTDWLLTRRPGGVARLRMCCVSSGSVPT